MDLIKVKELGTSCADKIIEKLGKFKVNEDNRFVKFVEKEISLQELDLLEKSAFLGDDHEFTFPVVKAA